MSGTSLTKRISIVLLAALIASVLIGLIVLSSTKMNVITKSDGISLVQMKEPMVIVFTDEEMDPYSLFMYKYGSLIWVAIPVFYAVAFTGGFIYSAKKHNKKQLTSS